MNVRAFSGEPKDSVRLRHRKRAIIASSIGYWFVTGIVFIAYAQSFNDAAKAGNVFYEHYDRFVWLLFVAMLGSRVFAFQWAWCHAQEYRQPNPVVRGLLFAIQCPDAVSAAGKHNKSANLSVTKTFVIIMANVLSCHLGAYAAIRAFYP